MRRSAKRFLSVLLTVAMVSQTLAPATEALASSVTNGDEAATTTVEKQAPAEDTEAAESETKSQDQPQGQATTPDRPTTTTTTTQAKPSPDASTASGLAPPIDVAVNDNDKADVRDEAKDMSSEVEEDAAATLLSSKVAKRTPARLLAAATSATAAAPDVTSADGNSIDALTVGWVTKDTTDDGNAANLLLVPNDNSKVSAVAEIDFSLSGEHDYAAGTLQVKIPAHVFSKRDGSAYGTTVIPYASSPSTRTEFNWALVGDSYVLTNTRTLSAATAASIQIGFENLTPSEVRDMATSEPLSAQVLVTTAMNHQITRHSNQITAQIDTHETVTAATKGHEKSDFFDILTAAQMKAKGYTIPSAYAGETRFVVAHWYTYGYHEGNTLYSMDWSDTPESKGAHRCFAVSPTSGSSTKDSWSENSQTGYVYVDVAYPLSQFKADTNYTLTNDATWTCTETDDGSVTSKSASATMPFSWSAPKSVIPKGHFYSQKWGEDDDADRTTHYDAYGSSYSTPGKNGNWLDLYSPYGTYETVSNDLANGKDSKLNYGQYIRGYVLPFTRVGTNNDKLSSFGGSDVTMTLTDGEDGLTYATSGKSVHLTGAGSYEFSSLHLIRPDVYKAVEFDGSDVSPSEIIRDSDEQVYLGANETAKGNTYGVGYLKDKVAADCPSFKVEAKVNGTWKTVTTVDWTAEGDTRDVAMPAGTTAYRVSVTIGKSTPTKDGTSFIAAVGDAVVEPIVTLHATDDVRAVAKKALDEQDMPVTTLENSQVFVATQNGTNLLTLTDAAVDYIYGITDDVSVVPSKTGVAFADYDEAAFKVHYSADVREQTNARSVASYGEAVTKGILTSDTSGTFYDLLPIGVTPDLSTVRVGHTTYSGTSNSTHFDPTSGTVTNAYTISNWRGTGRTMLVVNASLTPTPALYHVNGTTQLIADTPHIEFDASYTFDAFNDRSSKATATIHNVIAYESGNATLGNVANFAGEPDNPAAGRNTVSSTAFENDAEKAAMTDLDKRTDKPAFVYAGTTTTLTRLFAATSELTKQVEVNNDGTFGTGVTGSAEHKGTDDQERTVYVGGSYRYRLSDSAATDLKGVVLYDNLEDYVPTSDKADYQDTTWKGTLAGVDTSALTAKGVKPVVYYSTEPVAIASAGNDSVLSADGALTSGKWHVLTDDTDLSTVKAIAIDCSKATDGSDYTLAKGDSLTAFVSMRAPSGDAALAAIPTADGGTSADADGAHAYNNAFVNATAVATGVTQLVRKDYTKVGLKPYTLKVTKAWADHDDNDGIRPKSVTVHLYDVTDDRDTGKTVTLSADNKWTGTFTGLTATADDGSQAVYSFTEEGAPGYSLTSTRQTDGSVSLTNHHTLAITSLSGTKTWVGGASHPSSVTIEAYDVDDPSVTVASTVASGNGDTWDWSIKGLPKYKDHGKTVTYAVREVRTSDMADFAATVDGTSITNTYHPKGDLRIDKRTENTTAAADGQAFTMRVLLAASDGSDFVEKVPYQVLAKDGSVVSSGTYVNNTDFRLEAGQSMVLAELPKGTRYAVTEDRADGYTASWSNRTGTIASNVVTDVTCDNVYAATGTASVVATKALTGRTLRANEFTYVLTDADGNVVARGYNDADGKVALGALTYHVADSGKTFTYTLSEAANSDHRVGYTYDRTAYTVTVRPHDNGDGTMTCDVAYADKDGKAVTTPSFSNDFKSIGQASLTAYKQQLSGELKGNDYTFQLYDADGSKLYLDDNGHPTTTATDRPLQAKNAADGTIHFPDMTYTQDDLRNADGTYSSKTLTYAAREVVPDGAKLGDDGYYTVDGDTTKYSSQTFYWHVVLSDDGADAYGKAVSEYSGSGGEIGPIGPGEEPGEPVVHSPRHVMPSSLSLRAMNVSDASTDSTNASASDTATDLLSGYGIIHTGDMYDPDTDSLVSVVSVYMPNGMVYAYQSATDSVDTIAAVVKASIKDHNILNKYFVRMMPLHSSRVPSPESALSDIYGADGTGDNAFMGPAQLQVDTVRVDKDGKETDTMPLFVNAKKPGTLTVEKLTTGDVSDADPNQEFTFKVKITTPDGTSVPDDLGETLHRSSKSGSVAIDGSSDIDDTQALTLSITAPADSTATTVTINGSADDSDATTVTTVPGTAVTTTVHVKAGSHVSVLGLPEGSTYDVSSGSDDVYISNGSGTTAVNQTATVTASSSVPNTGFDGTAQSARRLVNTGTTSHSNMFPTPSRTESGKPSTGKWGLGSENAATSYSADELPDHITAGTWYAQAQTYAVSFDANGGSGSMATKNADSLTLPKPTFYRLGYTPTGWNTAADGKGTHYDIGTTFTPTADTTLYAEWTKDTNVTKNDDGTYTVTLKAGEAIDLSGLPAGSTYEVVESSVPGWTLTGSENANGTIEADQDMTATFTNAYTPGQTSATISATKTMDGTIPTGTYSFELKDSTGKVLQTVKNDGASVAFAPIAYTSAGTYTYTIDEVAGYNRRVSYDSHIETVTVTVTDDGHGNLSAAVAYDSDGASFANTSKPGSLAIGKYVTVFGKDIPNDNVYASKLFDIAVSLTDASGKELTGTYAWTSESGRSGTISSGGTVSVSYNDYVTITGLPAGTLYTVSEPSVPAGWTRLMNPMTGSYVASGIIFANGTSRTVIGNSYSASGSLALKAKKTFDGTLEAGQFSFTATVTDPNGKATTTSVTNDANGDISFSPVALTQAGTYKLSIAEDAGDDADVTYDTKTWTATATVTDDGEGHLVSSVSDWSDGSTTAKVPTFANTVAKTDLEISKTVSTKSAAAKSDATFDFVVTLPSGSYGWTSTDGTSGTIVSGGTVTLSDGETLTIKGLPVGSDYSVREVASANYSQTSAKGASGTLRSGAVAKASFTNAYQATGSVTLGLDKTLTDDTLTAGEFGFELYGQGTSGSESEASGTAVPDGYALIDKATNDADGKVTFNTIDYDASDLDGKASVTKTYVIREMGGGSTANGIAYDGSLVYAHVTLTDDGAGTIATSVSYTDAKGTALSSPGFTNRRTTASGAATISVTKSLKDDSGKALADWGGRTFEAVLTDADGNQLDTVTLSQETPMAAFDRLDYTLDSLANDDGTHDRTRVFTYYVTETAGTDQAVTYDTAKHKVQVTVTNEGSGQLSTAVAYDDGTTAVLENRLTELDLKVTKVDDANKPLKGATFALYNDDGETLDTASATPVATGTTDAEGHVTFSKAISSKGRYWLVETASPDGYILASPYVIEPGSGNEATVLRTTTAGTASTLGDSIGTIKASDGAYSVTITDSGVGGMPASGVRPVSLTLAAAALIALAISLAVWRRRWTRRHGEM